MFLFACGLGREESRHRTLHYVTQGRGGDEKEEDTRSGYDGSGLNGAGRSGARMSEWGSRSVRGRKRVGGRAKTVHVKTVLLGGGFARHAAHSPQRKEESRDGGKGK